MKKNILSALILISLSFILTVASASAESTLMKVPIFDKKGFIPDLTHQKAILYCQNSQHAVQPARLPSARDWARIASRNCSELGSKFSRTEPCGAKGIVTSCGVLYGSYCSEITAINQDGTIDHFFYSSEGYKTPLAKYRYEWNENDSDPILPSASVESYEDMSDTWIYIFDLGTGDIRSRIDEYLYTPICFGEQGTGVQ